ncbi:class I SAM-dependent methyltransferase [Mycobacteroides abscessus]|uniref:class I SAM-dependent methyltransferase n=1 Tax=Mycobacteroides abscessus TaxID=36809 RepID=UPI0030F3B137
MIAATEKKICGGWAGVLCRKRYIDEQLIDALTDGLDAVIILGGGFDTRLYRIPQLTGVPVWEVDLPAKQHPQAAGGGASFRIHPSTCDICCCRPSNREHDEMPDGQRI